MKDEIKEILNLFKDENVNGFIIYDEMYQNLKDYITNLQEEKKIPEKLNKQHFHNRQRQLANKINELIDYLKSKGEEK